MIIYGTRAAHLRTQNIPGKCPSCGNSNTTKMSVHQKYAHVFWIPFFPIGKVFLTQCSHCNQVLEKNEIKNHFRDSFIELNDQARTPIWSFSGLGLVAIIIVSSIISSSQNDKENKAMITSPSAGDVYHYKTKDNQYTLLKVSEIKGDTVYIFQHQYETDKISGIRNLKSKGDSAYSKESYGILKADLVDMLDKGSIIDVERK